MKYLDNMQYYGSIMQYYGMLWKYDEIERKLTNCQEEEEDEEKKPLLRLLPINLSTEVLNSAAHLRINRKLPKNWYGNG